MPQIDLANDSTAGQAGGVFNPHETDLVENARQILAAQRAPQVIHLFEIQRKEIDRQLPDLWIEIGIGLRFKCSLRLEALDNVGENLQRGRISVRVGREQPVEIQLDRRIPINDLIIEPSEILWITQCPVLLEVDQRQHRHAAISRATATACLICQSGNVAQNHPIWCRGPKLPIQIAINFRDKKCERVGDHVWMT